MVAARIPVSVCIPTFNGDRYLEKCLESVTSQSFTDLEILIVDDYSVDHSRQIAEKFARLDKRIKYIRNQKNLGLVNNWNKCIQLARGEWIKFVFQDDVIKPTCIEKMYNCGKALKKDLVVCRRDIHFDCINKKIKDAFDKYNSDISIGSIFKNKTEINAYEFCLAVSKNISSNFVGEPTAVLIHNQTFKRFGTFDNEFMQLCDYEFWCRIGCNIGIAYIPETLATFRVHPGATSIKNRATTKYKAKTVDRLYLYYKFSYSRFYSKLRYVSINSNPPINLKLLSILIHLREEAIVKSTSLYYRKLNSNPSKELSKYFEKYPNAKIDKKLFWIKPLFPFLFSKKIMRYIYSKVLMRLKIFNIADPNW
jgi:glycosyltransferase involved in cell wall biosynthesis